MGLLSEHINFPPYLWSFVESLRGVLYALENGQESRGVLLVACRVCLSCARQIRLALWQSAAVCTVTCSRYGIGQDAFAAVRALLVFGRW